MPRPHSFFISHSHHLPTPTGQTQPGTRQRGSSFTLPMLGSLPGQRAGCRMQMVGRRNKKQHQRSQPKVPQNPIFHPVFFLPSNILPAQTKLPIFPQSPTHIPVLFPRPGSFYSSAPGHIFLMPQDLRGDHGLGYSEHLSIRLLL